MHKDGTSRHGIAPMQRTQVIAAGRWRVFGSTVSVLQGGELLLSQDIPDGKIPVTFYTHTPQTKPSTPHNKHTNSMPHGHAKRAKDPLDSCVSLPCK